MDEITYNPFTGEMDIVSEGSGPVIVVKPEWETLPDSQN
jgi:hypothetical protein